MARPVDFRLSKYDTVATSTTARLPAGGVTAGQLIVAVFGFKASTGSHSTPTGYSVGPTIAGASNVLSAFYKIAGAGETDPIATHASDAERFGATFIIEDFDPVNPIDTSATGLTSATVTSGKLIAAPANLSVGNVLCLHVGSCAQWRHLLLDAGIMQLFSEYIIDGSYSAAAAWTFEESSGLSTAFGWSQSRAADSNARALCIPIRSASTPVIPARHNPSTTLSRPITPLAAFDATGPDSSSPRDPTGIGELTAINGVNTNKAADSRVPGYGVNPFNYESFASTGNSVAANEFFLTHYELDGAATVDASGKKVAVHPVNVGSPFRMGTVAESGMIVGLSTLDNGTDTTTFAYEIVTAGGIDEDGPAVKAVVFDESTNMLQSTNTPDWSTVNGIVFGVFNVAGADVDVAASDAQILETIEIIGGDDDASNAKWADWETAFDAARSANLRTVVKQGNAFLTFHDINVGDGSSFLQFSTNSKILQAPAAGNFQFQATSVALTVNLAASNVFNWVDPVEGGGTMDVVVGGSTSATVDFNGGLLNNPRSVALNDLGTAAYDGFTIANSSAELTGTGDRTGLTLLNFSSTQAVRITAANQTAMQTALDKLARILIDGSTTYGLLIEYTGLGNITLNAPTGLNIDKTHYTASVASTLTMVIGSSGANFGITSFGGSATGFNVSNEKTLTINFVDDQGTAISGVQLTVNRTGTETQELAVETSAGTSEAFSFTAPLAYNLDIFAFKEGYDGAVPQLNLDPGTEDSSVTLTLARAEWYS